MRPLLVLRPEPGASATAARIAAAGGEALVAPLFETRPRAWTPPAALPDALLVTSAAAVRHGGSGLARYLALPVVAVGAATATALSKAGFADVRDGGGDAVSSAALLGTLRVGHVLHLCGRERVEVPVPGVRIERVPVYAADAVPPPAAFAQGIARGAVLLVHSPRAGARVAELVGREARGRLSLAAISPAALDSAGDGWGGTAVAPRPDDPALVAAALSLV